MKHVAPHRPNAQSTFQESSQSCVNMQRLQLCGHSITVQSTRTRRPALPMKGEKILDSVLDGIGQTPLIRINSLGKEHECEILAKVSSRLSNSQACKRSLLLIVYTVQFFKRISR